MRKLRKGTLVSVTHRDIGGEAILLKDLTLNKNYKGSGEKLVFKIGNIIHTSEDIYKIIMVEDNIYHIRTVFEDEYFISPIFNNIQENLMMCAWREVTVWIE